MSPGVGRSTAIWTGVACLLHCRTLLFACLRPWRGGASRQRAPRGLAVAVLLGLMAGALPALAETPADLIGRTMPAFQGKGLVGHNLRSEEYVGDVVLMGFWASWCSDCREQLERLQVLHSTYRGAGLVVIGVNLDDSAADGRDAARAAGIQFPVLFDSTKEVSKRFALSDLPTLVLVDRAGRVRYVHGRVRDRDEPDLMNEIRQLLDE